MSTFSRFLGLLCLAGSCVAQPANPHFGRGLWRGNVVDFRVVNGWALVERDIIAGRAADLTARYDALWNARTELAKQQLRESIVVADQARLWPDGVIPYEVDPTLRDPTQITRAIQHWNERTTLKIVPRNGEANYVKFTPFDDPTICASSAVGMRGGMQLVYASETCGANLLIHEIGHVVGLSHEQSRTDRDRYVRLLWENITKFGLSQYGASTPSTDYGPYDYYSVMHYRGDDFTKNGLATMESKPAGIPMGQALVLSDGDISAADRLYGRNPGQVTISSTPPGLRLVVDGETIIAPRAFTWGLDTPHTVEALQVQTGLEGRYEYARWSDNGDRVHTITVKPETATLYTANFVRYNKFNLRVAPESGGTIRLNPESADGYYRDATVLTFTAVPNPGFVFAYWEGPFVEHNINLTNLPVNPLRVLVDADFQNLTARFVSAPTTTPSPANRPVTSLVSVLDTGEPIAAPVRVDGRLYSTPTSFTWEPGSTHEIDIAPSFPVAGDFSLRSFQNWADGKGEHQRQVVTGEQATTYIARYTIQYAILSSTVGPGGIRVFPQPPGFYLDRDSAVELNAVPEDGNQFVGWGGDLGGRQTPRRLVIRESMDVFGFFGASSSVSNFGIMNAARQRPNTQITGTSIFAKISPGEVVTINMAGVGPDTPADAVPSEDGSISTRLSQTRVLVGGVAVPVLSAAKGQVTAFIPYGASVLVGRATGVQIEYGGAPTGAGFVAMVAANPAIYTSDGSGNGQARVTNETGAPNGSDAPALRGSVVTVLASGLGLTSQTASDNRVSQSLGPGPRGELEVRIGGAVADVVSAGIAPGQLGVYRIAVRVPELARSGTASPLILTVDGAPSQFNVTMAIQ